MINLTNEIQKEHSKENTIRIASIIGNDEILFRKLMDIYFDKANMDLARKSAWIVRECVETYPYLFNPYVSKSIRYLKNKGLHDAIKRNALAILESREFNEKDAGLILDISFELLKSASEPIAVKAFAMGIIHNITKTYPEVGAELKLVLEDQLPYGSAGFKNRAIKILNSLR